VDIHSSSIRRRSVRISSSLLLLLLLFGVELSAADAPDAVDVVVEADVEAVLAVKPPFSSSVSIVSELLFDSPVVLDLCLDDDDEEDVPPSVLLEAVRDRAAARIMARRLSM
jgi:hypothetical protein